MLETWQKFYKDESGATANEYALIAIICSVAMIAGLLGTRDGINESIAGASDGLQAAAQP